MVWKYIVDRNNYQRNYYHTNKYYGISQRLKGQQYRHAISEIILDEYGSKCTCCGETERKFLTIDHMNNDGHLDRVGKWRRSSYSMKLKVVREGFPDKYELRCYNCNLGRAANKGVCPHAS